MSLDLQVLNNTAVETGISPFFRGGSAVFVNLTDSSLIVQGSDDGATGWATFVTVPAGAMIKGSDLPPFIRVSTAATIYALA